LPDGVIGNTTGFGPVILGSSPNRVTKVFINMKYVEIHEEIDHNDKLVVSFASLVELYGGLPRYEFVKSLKDIKSDKVFLSDTNRLWYVEDYKEIITYLKELTKNYKKVIFIGSSLGGFASIFFSIYLKPDVSISFSPQTTLNLELLEKVNETRFSKHHNRLVGVDTTPFELQKLIKENSETKFHIFYPSYNPIDFWYVKRLPKQMNIIKHPQPTDKHNVAGYINNYIGLPKIISYYL
jgi:hypothetical protein